MIPYARVVLLTTVALAGACARRADPPAPAASAAETPASPIVFDDAMSPAERSEFYHLAEGSEMLPVEWFFALENETDGSLYADHLERFNLIADAKSAANPFGLPVGLTSAETRDLRFTGVQMVGVTCAAWSWRDGCSERARGRRRSHKLSVSRAGIRCSSRSSRVTQQTPLAYPRPPKRRLKT